MRLPLLAGLLLWCAGCNAVSYGSKLTDRPPQEGRGLYLSTGGSPWAFRTLGFAQVTGYGVTVAGVSDVGNAAIDPALKGALVDAALRMGGDGVINIEFEDLNPPSDMERASDLSESISNGLSGQGGVKTRDRSVLVTGEIIQFLPAP
ncbi:MAG: hypothetical protein ABW123_04145 [Cystobacter sp.]